MGVIRSNPLLLSQAARAHARAGAQERGRFPRAPLLILFFSSVSSYRWKADPEKPKPMDPVHSSLKLAAVLGTSSPYKPITMRPAGAPPISMSKKTLSVTLPDSPYDMAGKRRERESVGGCVRERERRFRLGEGSQKKKKNTGATAPTLQRPPSLNSSPLFSCLHSPGVARTVEATRRVVMAAGERVAIRAGLVKARGTAAAAAECTARTGAATRTVRAAARRADEVEARRVVAIWSEKDELSVVGGERATGRRGETWKKLFEGRVFACLHSFFFFARENQAAPRSLSLA